MMRDALGTPIQALHSKRLFLLDMDGTIYNEETLFPGTPDFLSAIRATGGRAVFITNNSSKSVEEYVQKLSRMGVPAAPEDLYTSTQATAAYILEHYPNTLAFCVGTRAFISELNRMGVSTADSPCPGVGLVVAAFDRELTYQKLRDASALLTAGLPFIAANPDRACPVSFGFEPDCGAICEALFFATGRRPLYIGKPAPTMLQYVVEHSAFTKAQALVVGDRLYTDIAAGVNAGIDTVCVLSGEATLADIDRGDVKPTWVLRDIRDITEALICPSM